jgi:hypothetical protein
MANTKKYIEKKRTAKKSATRVKTRVVDTFACGCCTPIVTVDECGCMETLILC